MPESPSHKEAKTKAAGKSGRTEVPVKGGRRIDAATSYRAVEVERSGALTRLEEAARKLRDSGKSQHVLIVPQKDMKKAQQAMRDVRITGAVRNLSGTKIEYVGARKARPPTIAGKTTSRKK